jgi:hypothetical protein
MDGTRCPDGCLGYEAAKERLRGCAEVVAALWMPLDSDDEVRYGSFGGLPAFYGFNDGVLGAAGRDAEAVTGDSDGLMVAGVDGKAEVAALFLRFVRRDKAAEERVVRDGGGVGDSDAAACGVIDREDAEILD